MPRDEEEYKDWQDRYESLNEEWDENWSDEETRNHYENMKDTNEKELQGREETREEWADDGNEGHDRRIEDLRDRDQLLNHGIAHAEGEYEYEEEGMQDMDPDLKRELERKNDERWENNDHIEGDEGDEHENEQEETSDMEIESDSD